MNFLSLCCLFNPSMEQQQSYPERKCFGIVWHADAAVDGCSQSGLRGTFCVLNMSRDVAELPDLLHFPSTPFG